MEIAGDSKASRAMYAQVVLKYHTLISEAETARGKKKFSEFCMECFVGGGISRDEISAVELELYLFLVSHPNIRSTATSERNRFFFNVSIFSTSMHKLLTEKGTSAPAIKLYAAWLESETEELAVLQGFRLAMELKIREVIPAVLKIARDDKREPSYRSMACVVLGQIGTLEQLKELAPLAGDDSLVQETSPLKDGPSGTIFLGDVAMAIVLKAGEQKLADYGYDMRMFPVNFGLSVIPDNYGFLTKEKRKAGREKFAKWWANR